MRCRAKVQIMLSISVLILMVSSPVLAVSYFGYQDWGGTWHDASQDPYGSMCWAATASDVLAYGKWGTSEFNNETAIFNQYTAYWNNTSGNPADAWAWWLDGGNYSGMKQSGGGDYWPDHTWSNYYTTTTFQTGNIMAGLEASLHAGYGIVLNIRWDGWWGFGHGLTLWGIEEDPLGNYTGIWVTDPNDNTTGLVYYSIGVFT